MKLFDKIPDNFFSPLARKYRAVYAFALLTLYDHLIIYRSEIKKVDFINALKNKGSELINLFNPQVDKEESDEENITDIKVDEEDPSSINSKTNYIVRELQNCGWFQIEKDKYGVEKIYLPVYSIQMIEVIYKMASEGTVYLPLVHQTYSELNLENEKEDDQMFRTLCNAEHNAQELELSVTTLKHSIKVFGSKLQDMTNPNEALRSHFDLFKVQIGDKIYHPMKTYDSLGLYTQPIVDILRKWLRDNRIITKLVTQAKYDGRYVNQSTDEIAVNVTSLIQRLIDTFSGLNREFFSIDKDNADYTEAVQKKVNFLSSSDKTMEGKIDAIIVRLAEIIRKSNVTNLEELDIEEISDTIDISSKVFIDSDSLTMPRERKQIQDVGFLPMDEPDDFFSDDNLFNFIETEVSLFSDEAVKAFYLKNFKGRKEILTTDFTFTDLNDFVLYIYGIVKASFGNYYFDIEKICDGIRFDNYLMPKYKFIRKESFK